MTGMLSSLRTRRRATALLVFLASATDLTVLSRDAPIHVDEAWMLNRGFMAAPLYRQYLRTGKTGPGWDSWLWQPRKPPLGNVVIGLGLWLGGRATPDRPYRYDWRHDHAWNIEHRDTVNLPPAGALRAGRMLVPVFSAAATTAVFLLTASAAGNVGGLVAATIFQLNPVVRLHGSHALSDMVMMSLALWAVWYLACHVAPRWTGPRGPLARRVVLLAVLIGLAAATKQNGSLAGLTALVAFGVWGLEHARAVGPRAAAARTVLCASILTAGAYGTYIAVNPGLHREPIGGAVAQVRAWDRKFDEHRGRRPEQALTTIGARIGAVAGTLVGTRHGGIPVPYVVGLLALGGVGLLALGRAGPSWWRAPPRIILLWAGVTTLVVSAWVPLDWDRYFLPVIALQAVLVGSVARLARLMRPAPRETGLTS